MRYMKIITLKIVEWVNKSNMIWSYNKEKYKPLGNNSYNTTTWIEKNDS